MSGVTGSYIIPTGAPATPCAPPMSRVALLALRNAASLDPQCHYVVNDHAQGQVPAGTLIVLHATAPDALGQHVHVLVPGQQRAWHGVYNLDAAILTELADNRGNVVRDVTGLAISTFDWGNPAYSDCLVDHSTVVVSYGNGAPVIRLRALANSYVDLTNYNNIIFDVTVARASTLIAIAADCPISTSEIANGSFVDLSNAPAGSFVSNARLHGATIAAPNRADLIQISANLSESTIAAGNVSGALRLINDTTVSRSIITQENAIWIEIEACQIHATEITIRAGSVFISQSRISASFLDNGGDMQTLNILRSRIEAGSSISLYGGQTIDLSQCSMDTGRVFIPVPTAANLSITNTNIATDSQIQILHSGASTMSLASCAIRRNGQIIRGFAHDGTISLISVDVDGAIINASGGPRSLTMVRAVVQNDATVLAAGSNAGSTTISAARIANGGLINDSVTSGNVVASGITIDGPSALLALTGANTIVNINTAHVRNGTIQIGGNSAAVSLTDTEVGSQGNVQIFNNTGIRSVSRCTAINQGTIQINHTAAGFAGHTNLLAVSGLIFVSATSGTSNNIRVWGGSYVQAGGVSQFIDKHGAGAVSSGGFNQSGLVWMAPAGFICSGPNTNVGLISFIDPAAHVAPPV